MGTATINLTEAEFKALLDKQGVSYDVIDISAGEAQTPDGLWPMTVGRSPAPGGRPWTPAIHSPKPGGC